MRSRKVVSVVLMTLVLGMASYIGVKSYVSRGQESVGLVDAQGEAIQQIDLLDNRALPDSVSVPLGHSVQFNATDGLKHRMGFGVGGHEHREDNLYDSGEFGAGESWRVAFNKPGTYQFHDHLNPSISVLVVAYQP